LVKYTCLYYSLIQSGLGFSGRGGGALRGLESSLPLFPGHGPRELEVTLAPGGGAEGRARTPGSGPPGRERVEEGGIGKGRKRKREVKERKKGDAEGGMISQRLAPWQALL